MPKTVEILKVRFDTVTEKEALEKALEFAKSKKQHYICTPNPEILLEARKNPKFLKILNKSDLNIADGIGILWAATFLEKNKNRKSKILKTLSWFFYLCKIIFVPSSLKKVIPERVTGTDLMQKICARAQSEKLKVFLLGAAQGIAKKTAEKFIKKHKNLKIVGTHSGSPSLSEDKEITDKINKAKPDILFVAYGAPSQEIWIARNLKKLKTVHLALGIGGAFDFIAGTRHRAPRLLRKLGLEWLWRLIQQPSRIKRIYNATVKFPIKILIS